MKLRTLILTTLAAGGLVAAIPHQAEARVVINFNTAPECQGFTRTFLDNYGYQRTATGTACLQPNGMWQVVSENVNPLPSYYSQPVVYRRTPVYYGPMIVERGRDHDDWDRFHHRDWDDHGERRDHDRH